MRRAFSLLAVVCAFGLIAEQASAQTVIKAAFGSQPGHPSFIGLERFKELVEEKTGGSVIVELYPDRQLGEERETVEGLQLGTVDLTVVSTGPLGAFVPQVNVLDLPFLFKDSDHVYRVLDGEVGQDLLQKFDAVGIVGLAWWENGWRHLTAKKQIEQPSDLSGVKLRTMQNPVHIAAFQTLGAAPIPMVWGEVFTSLGQGVIDAQENPITVIYTNSLWEVQSHVMLTGHVYGPHAVLFSKATWGRLSEAEQQAVRDAAREATDYQRKTSASLEAENIEKLREKGMVVQEVDIGPFQSATADLANTAPNIDGEMIVKIRALAD
jgi:tripartite ATP-independent transporter DctP family solute receptor